MRKTVRNRVLRAAFAVCAALVMFAGCSGSDDDGESLSENQNPSGNQEQVTTCKVIFYPNVPTDVTGVFFEAKSRTYDSDSEQQIPDGLFSLDGYGYRLAGWADSAEAETPSYQVGDGFIVYADRRFYAVWESTATTWEITVDGIVYAHKVDDEGNGYYEVRGISGMEISETNIKSEIDGIPVTTIGYTAFSFCDSLTSIEIPDSVTSIGVGAFGRCGSLTNVVIGNGVTSIGRDAFNCCNSLTNVIIGNSVTSIEECAFRNCGSLTSIDIPNSVTTIGTGAFSDCDSLTNIRIEDGVTGIGGFNSCNNLTSIEIPNSVMSIGEYAFSSCDGLTSIEIPDSVTSIGEYAFSYCNNLSDVEIPDNVTSIGNCAFLWCENLISVRMGDGLASIGEYAFSYCNRLSDVEISDNVTTIGSGAFSHCYRLINIEIPCNVTSIGKNAFGGCTQLVSIAVDSDNPSYSSQDGILYNKDKTELICVPQAISGTVTIPNTVTSIGEGAFARCYLESITIPDSVTSIGEGAFADSYSLTEITLPFVGASKDGIGNTCLGYIFGGTDNSSVPRSLTNIIIHGDTTSIGENAFSGCGNLTSVTIGNGVTSIGSNAFNGCSSLTSMTIGGDVTSIGENAFSGCSSLTNMTIGGGVTSIGYDVFRDCGRLKSIIIDDSNPSYSSQDGILYNKNKTEIIYALKAISGVITIPNSVTSIKSGAFNGCNNLTSIEIPDSVTSIEENAFGDCRNLASITIDVGNPSYSSQDGILYNKNKTEILYALKAISGAITIPTTVTNIREGVFSGCSNLTSVTIPNNVTSIGKSAFSGCISLRKIILPFVGASKYGTSNNYLGYIFGGTDNRSVPRSLTVVILDGITSIGKNAFSGCSGLVSVTIPDSVTSIENGAFRGCGNLTEIILPFVGASKYGTSNIYFDYIFGGTASSISSSSYNSLVPQSLKRVTITGNNIGDYAFWGCAGLTNVTILYGTVSIGSGAFCNCKNLVSVTIPNSVTDICSMAFYGCMGLKHIIFEGTQEQWNSIRKGAYWDYSTGGIEGQVVGNIRGYTITYTY